MVDDKKIIEKAEKEIAKEVAQIEEKVEDKKMTQEEANKEIEKEVKEDIKDAVKETEKTESSKKKKIVSKDLAVANAFSLKISAKQSKYICKIIKGKTPDAAVARLQEVIDEKRAVPMAGLEVGHKKGKGLAGGKFPKNACREIMEVVKQVKANALVNGVENPVITIAKADRASRPYRRQGQKGKRAHIHLEVRDATKVKVKRK